MNLYFSSVASQPPGYSSLSKVNTNTKHTGHASNTTHSLKQHVTLTNAIDLLTGSNSTNLGSSSRNSFSISGYNQVKKSDEATPMNIVLRRASIDSPWGFRVQGGSDYHLQLTICKTQNGSPSEGVLQSGDEILLINGENARSLSHEQATQKIRSAGTDLQLTVARRQTCDLSDIRPKGLLKFTAPQNNKR
ncbi:PDZ and LIM domain protein [Schistosoma japonicum]|uniref:PDZ and LIM domain protein n=1 Tax=Schistosoma japonicum TaxID=6182 RepID=A0A4Z2D824_SCHJA|nr:PDZ and LIM domain protein [Schistosoma japonicum]TNN12655.1 PDZ and LIM domain protein [Schistosoma japonicum]